MCPTAVSWFAALARMSMMTGLVSEVDELVSWSVENIEELLTQLGLHGPKFERVATELLGLIDKSESTPFSRGLEQLGRSLGFLSWRPGVQGAPDCVWTLADRLCIVFEAKSEESASDPIPIRDVREAKGHLDWVSANVKLADNAEVVVSLVSPRSVIAKEALPHAEGVYRLGVDEIRSLARKAVGSLRAARAQSATGATDALRANIQQQLVAGQLSPRNLLEHLKSVPVKSLPQT